MRDSRTRYRWLLRLLPPSFREDVERDLIATWQAEERDTASRARRGFWRRAITDTLAVGVREYVDACRRNLRVAARQLRRSPAFLAATVLTLALGIGATTGVFVLVDAVLLRPLPWRAPETIGLAWAVPPDGERTWLSRPELDDMPRLAPGVSAIAGVMDVRLALSGGAGSGESVEVQGLAVSHGALRLLGIEPALGRDLSPEDDRLGAAPVVILGHDLWRTRFGGDPSIVGRTITLDERACRVIGVLPAGFSLLPPTSVLPDRIDVWVPLEPVVPSRDRSVRFLHALVRLRGDATFAAVDAALGEAGRGWTRSLGEAYPRGAWTFSIVSFERDVLRRARSVLWLLSGLVGLVLALACTNVAHLLAARHEARRTDVAVRTALGASAAQLAGEQLAEAAIVGGAAGLLGLGLAAATPALLRAIEPGALPRLEGASLDGRALLFAAAVVAAATLSAALAGVLSRRWLGVPSLLGPGRSAGRTRRGAGLGRALIVVQTGGTVAILVAAFFLADALAGLQRVDVGVRADGLATARVSLSSRYRTGPPSVAFFERAVEALAARPGVAGAAAISQLPLSGALLGSTFVDAEPRAEARPDARIDVDLRAITPAYLAVAGTPLVAGRAFTAADAADGPRVAIVDTTLAHRLAPDGQVVGRRVRWIRQPDVDVQIVGVAAAVRHRGIADAPVPTVYRPLAQYPRTSMFLVARPRPGATIGQTDWRAAVDAADPTQALADVVPMRARVARNLARSRTSTVLALTLAVLAMVLAGVGIYGVIAIAVARRRREFGVRLAIGANPSSIRALVLREGLRLASVGIALGAIGAMWIVGLTRTALPVETGSATKALAGAVALVLAGVVTALWLPARRAAAIEPRSALQAE